jgi:hypothetical protein
MLFSELVAVGDEAADIDSVDIVAAVDDVVLCCGSALVTESTSQIPKAI